MIRGSTSVGNLITIINHPKVCLKTLKSRIVPAILNNVGNNIFLQQNILLVYVLNNYYGNLNFNSKHQMNAF